MPLLDEAELRRILREGEGVQVEFKEGLSDDRRVARTLAAFANTRGGIVIVGVSDRGMIRGVPRSRDVAAEIRLIGEAALDPAIEVDVESLRTPSGKVVVASVPLSPSRPHAWKDGEARRVYVRRGSSNREVKGAAIEAIGVGVGLPPRDALESQVLGVVASAGPMTVAAYVRDHGPVGKQKARQAFESLERAGLLVAKGLRERRVYRLP